MPGEPQPYDEWLNSVVQALRGLFRNDETPPRVASVVAPDSGASRVAATSLPMPDREQSTGSWDEVPEIIEVLGPAVVSPPRGFVPRSELPRVVPAHTYTERDEPDPCRHCGAGIIHRPGDVPRFWCTQWGKRYPTDFHCYGLRKADRKFQVPCLAAKPHLTPCKLCV